MMLQVGGPRQITCPAIREDGKFCGFTQFQVEVIREIRKARMDAVTIGPDGPGWCGPVEDSALVVRIKCAGQHIIQLELVDFLA